MQSISKYIRPFLFPCLYCGSFRSSDVGLCQLCLDSLKRFEGDPLHEIHEAPYPIYAMYDWRPSESDMLSKLFLSMKGAGGKNRWQSFAPSFLGKRLAHPSLWEDRPVRIVPAPSSTGRKDHAYFWAESLAETLQGELTNCLVKRVPKHQRGASRDQRQRLRLGVSENYSDLSGNGSRCLWIFVDDILTTGATAHAAYEALGSPPHFEVWVLGRRSLSCGASIDLL